MSTHGGPVSDLWCFDVTPKVHQNIVSGTAAFLFMQQEPSPHAFHACGVWLLLKKLDPVICTEYTTPGFSSAAVRLGSASYEQADYHENNGWDPEVMERSYPYPFRAYPIIEIKLFRPTKVPVPSSHFYVIVLLLDLAILRFFPTVPTCAR